MNKGLKALPLSVYILISLFMKLFTIEISFEIFPFRLCLINSSIISLGEPVIPTHEPFINILLFPLINSELTSLNC